MPINPPWADGADPALLAMGFRSPWKGLYHNGRWYVGDVGDGSWEEINVLVEGANQNFGWPEVEGPCTEHPDPEEPRVHQVEAAEDEEDRHAGLAMQQEEAAQQVEQ